MTKIKACGSITISDIEDGIDITSVTERYYRSTSSTELVGGSWSADYPGWQNGTYIWTKSVITYSEGEPTETEPICVTGSKGENGRGITSVDVYYYKSSSSTTLTGGSWSTTAPSWENGKYIWSKTIITYDKGDPDESTPVCITGAKGETGEGSVTVVIGNESQNIPCTETGIASSAFLINIPFAGYKGTNRVACTASVGTLPSGVTLNSNTASTTSADGSIVLSVASGATFGGSSVLTGEITLTFTLENKSIVKKFSWTKTKDGAAAVTYILEPSTLVIKKGADDALSPTTVTFSAYSRTGNTTTRTVYAGRFVISESTNGTTFTNKYSSAFNESSKQYTPSSSSVTAIKCILYAAGGTTTQLDVQTIVILTDIDNIDGDLETIRTSISDVSSKVDANTKSITDKVWQTDITNSINTYDNTTTQALRDRVTQTETDITGIRSTVSDVQTTLEKKADGSTITKLQQTVTENRQDADSFKTTVSQTYATKESLSNYSTTEQVQSAIEQKANSITSTITQEYTNAINDIEIGGRNILALCKLQTLSTTTGCKVYDSNGNISSSTPTSDYRSWSYDNCDWKDIDLPAGTYTMKLECISENTHSSLADIYMYQSDGTTRALINEIKTAMRNNTNAVKTFTLSEDITAGFMIKVFSGTFRFKLEKGNKATDWSPAPEDINNKIDTVESNITQRADNIELSVAQKENVPVTAVRYIRDWLYGIKDASSIDNKWVECDVIAQNTNISSGITPTYKNSSLTAITVSNPEYYTDGMLLDEALERYISSTENSCLEIDLGDVYYNIDYIRVWHYYEDNRVYNHKMQISTDGVSWVTIYDSDITGGYAETSYGKVYYLNNAAVAENIALLNISANQIESRIENIEGSYSSIKEQADKIESIVGSESEDGATGLISSINNLDSLIAKLRSEYEEYKSDSGTSISTLTQTMNEITSRIATVEGNTRDISEIRQDAKGWQALFAQLDMYDMPEITTNISIDINGITVTNPTTRQQTKITIDEFSGWYNNEKIFWIDKDTTKTRRLLCEKGWDTGTDFIKMTTNSYTYSDGRTLNGVAYIKSGGSS